MKQNQRDDVVCAFVLQNMSIALLVRHFFPALMNGVKYKTTTLFPNSDCTFVCDLALRFVSFMQRTHPAAFVFFCFAAAFSFA